MTVAGASPRTVRSPRRPGSGGDIRIPWAVYVIFLLGAPLVFSSSGSVALLSQMACAMVFGLAYNMLLGQGGMLSFGHAVYSGLGAFCAVYAMNQAAHGGIWMPVVFAPLVGGLAGGGFGLLFGYVTTKRAGTTFAMITLGIAELVFVGASMFPNVFGGESGVSTTRSYGHPIFGLTFGPAIQAYYLIVAWVLLSSAAMFAFTRTPLGLILNAVRDNPERVDFVGYDAVRVRYISMALSCFFAGIGGGLTAINFEIVTTEALGPAQSGTMLIFTFIGGTSLFFGPVIGAILGTLLTTLLATVSSGWPLYLGLFFILVVKFAPGGIAGGLAGLDDAIRRGDGDVRRALAVLVIAVAVTLIGAIFVIEMLYQLKLETANGTTLRVLGLTVDSRSTIEWMEAIALLCAGGIWARRAGNRFAEARGRLDRVEETADQGSSPARG